MKDYLVKALAYHDQVRAYAVNTTVTIGDFTSYLFNSEQTPSAVGVGVLVNPDDTIQTAGGFIIQLMPGAEDEIISTIEERLKGMAPISSMCPTSNLE